MSVSSRSLFDTTADGQYRPTRPPRAVGVTRALGTVFNLFALNVVFVVASLPLVTLPVALHSAALALDRWRVDGEDLMVGGFLRELRTQPKLRRTGTLGVPLVCVLLAAIEIRFSVRTGGAAGAICVGLGAAGLMLTLAGLGYLVMLGVRHPGLTPTNAWYAAIVLVMTNLLGASALLVVWFVVVGLVVYRDPQLSVIGLPLVLLVLVRVSAERGIRHTEQCVPGAIDFFNQLEVTR